MFRFRFISSVQWNGNGRFPRSNKERLSYDKFAKRSKFNVNEKLNVGLIRSDSVSIHEGRYSALSEMFAQQTLGSVPVAEVARSSLSYAWHMHGSVQPTCGACYTTQRNIQCMRIDCTRLARPTAPRLGH